MQNLRARFRELNDATICFILDNKEYQLVYIVFDAIRERRHLIKGFNYCQKSILIVYRVVKLNIELHRDHITIGLLDKHGDLVVNNV